MSCGFHEFLCFRHFFGAKVTEGFDLYAFDLYQSIDCSGSAVSQAYKTDPDFFQFWGCVSAHIETLDMWIGFCGVSDPVQFFFIFCVGGEKTCCQAQSCQSRSFYKISSVVFHILKIYILLKRWVYSHSPRPMLRRSEFFRGSRAGTL